MGKKNLTKNRRQKDLLEIYYQRSGGCWSREHLNRIAQDLGLTRQQVYKWLWDKRNVEKKKDANLVSNYVQDQEIQEEQIYESSISSSEEEMHSIFYNKCSIKIPSKLRRAVEFVVDPSVSIWVRNLLREQGWQFIKLKQERAHKNRFEQLLQRFATTKSKVEEDSIKEIESPKNVIKPSRFDLVNEQFEQNLPFFKSKLSSNVVKEEHIEEPDAKHENYFMRKEFKSHFLSGFQAQNSQSQQKPRFSPQQKISSDSIFESHL